jgi:hypothetical protein
MLGFMGTQKWEKYPSTKQPNIPEMGYHRIKWDKAEVLHKERKATSKHFPS